ncbi:hypothetical protein SHOU24_37 [Vibrio phage SHOU24]|uniref:hypothetical protein n=1 Tax=Vibrio phage SHOU24 TaxID=1414739 RepID=UPI0003ED24DC|nr:hypothetical protein SHOU24_37 [Vibrio phage SHOU24]AHI61234.1 hypothetical protein SHOU24_37 [Vibrio phage SHOU24]
MGLVKSSAPEEMETVETNEVSETETAEVSAEQVNEVIAQAQEEEVSTETEVATEPETEEPVEEVSTEPETETAEEPVQEEVEEVSEPEIVEEKKMESKPKPKAEEKKEVKSTEVAVSETKSTAVAKADNKQVAASQVIQQAEDDGFGGLELGFGSFAIIKLDNSGQFMDSDDNELGTLIRASVQQSTASYLYVQEGNDDSPAVYSYDGVNLTAETEDGDKTVEQVKMRWVDEGYDMECRKYLEVVATIAEDHDDIIDGEVPEGLLDYEGETVMLRLPPASIKTFSGKVATLKMQNKPLRGAVMDFKVGKQRKTNNGKAKYFPWKISLVK